MVINRRDEGLERLLISVLEMEIGFPGGDGIAGSKYQFNLAHRRRNGLPYPNAA